MADTNPARRGRYEHGRGGPAGLATAQGAAGPEISLGWDGAWSTGWTRWFSPPALGVARSYGVVQLALTGLAAVLAITVGASLPSSPFALKQPGVWYFGIPAFGTDPAGILWAVALTYGGMILLMTTWYRLVRTGIRHRELPLAWLVVVFAMWTLPLLVVPPLFSRDIYSYAAQGDMVTHGISPYLFGPYSLGGSRYTLGVDPLWGNAPAPYGPLFLSLAAMVDNITGHHDLASIVGLRLLELAGVVLIAVYLPRLARAVGHDGALAFTIGVLNPLTLLHLVGGGHNDALMLGLMIAGLALAKEGRPVAGIVMCSLAAAVKVPALAGVGYIGWEWMGLGVPWRERLRPVVTAGIIAIGILAVLAQLTGLGWGWVLALDTPGTVRTMLSPATASGVLLGHLAQLLGTGVSTRTVLSVTRGLGFAAAAAVGAVLLWRSEQVGSVKALGLTLLAVVVLGPVVQPWYLTWGVVVLAAVATGALRSLVVWLSMLASFIGLPGAAVLAAALTHSSPESLLGASAFLLSIPAIALFQKARIEGAAAGSVTGGDDDSEDDLVDGELTH